MMEYYKLGINNGFFEKSLRYPCFGTNLAL